MPAQQPANRYEAAAHFLERAASSGPNNPNVLYLLALAHKRQGKIPEARAALRKIAPPDANVLLQLGLLSLAEDDLDQAEGDLARAWALDPTSYEIAHNLLLTQLTLGKLAEATALVSRAVELSTQRSPGERRFLQVLHALLRASQREETGLVPDTALGQLTDTDEARLLSLIRRLGHLDTMLLLLRTSSDARPRSVPVREAYIEVALVKGKELIDRCHWVEADMLLRPLLRDRSLGRPEQTALLNLLGCCAAMTQDFDGAERHFAAAVKQSPGDARLHQNLALTHEFRGELSAADPHWNRFFDLLDGADYGPIEVPKYTGALAYEAMSRLAGKYIEKERWTSALGYLQRASQLRPNDPDTLERLFHLYNQAKRPGDARRTLDLLRRLRPAEPQYELYELDLVEVKGLNDIERLLTEIDRIRKRYPGDARVEERAIIMVNNVVPLMEGLCNQLTDQMSKVIDQVRSLPNYQINWSAVREVMRDLLKEFQKLRRITGKCLPLITNDEYRRSIRDLADHIDKKIEVCRSMGA